jgi:transcription initiation factor TFIIB
MLHIDGDDPIWGVLRDAPQQPQNPQQKQPHEQKKQPGEQGAGEPSCATAGCVHCGGPTVLHDGYWVCGVCSCVADRQLDYGAEWRCYSNDDSRAVDVTRCSPPSNGLISSLGSVVSYGPRRSASAWSNRTLASAAAAESSVDGRRALQRCQAWSSFSYRERVLCGIFDQLAVNAATHCLPACILEEAKTLYKRVSDGRITRGAHRAAVVAVSMYVACKKCGVPRSHKEIAVMFDIQPSQLTRACHLFHDVVQDADCVASKPSDFVGRFCSALGLPPDAVELVRLVVARADELSIVCDVMPPSVVAGAVMLVCRELGLLNYTKDVVAPACLVAPGTVDKLYRRLVRFKDQLLAPQPQPHAP